jgi:L-ribulose-5-phosphate 3-epimerase UlaE
MNRIGVMQGRLLPKYKGRYQAHPVGYWEKEFSIASNLKLESIEFIFDYNNFHSNPLYSEKGIKKIIEQINQSGVAVKSVCADYLMEAPLHSEDPDIVTDSQNVIINLLKNLALLEIKDLVIPCVDQSSLRGDQDKLDKFIKNINPIIEVATKYEINLSLETDLSPMLFYQLLNFLPYKFITVNYDTGNSASLGYDPIEEFKYYGNRISDIHIKDRKLNSSSVILGTGDVNFLRFFEALDTITYNSPFIMQAYRDDEGVEIFKQQLNFFRELLNNSK